MENRGFYIFCFLYIAVNFSNALHMQNIFSTATNQFDIPCLSAYKYNYNFLQKQRQNLHVET